MSRGLVRKVIERGGVYLDGKRCRIASRALRPGQRVEMVLEESGRAEVPEPAPLVVLHEDAEVLAVDKPAGLPSAATPSGETGTLPWLVARHLKRKVQEVATVHRLDRETSGVVVFGKTGPATRSLAAAFREGTARKTYAAIVHGRLEGEGVIDEALGPDKSRRGSFRVDPQGIPALTRWAAASPLGDAGTLVRLDPETGRTHQLRVHLAHLGHPIAGDLRYRGGRAIGPAAAMRVMLHARRLTLPHPRGGTLEVRAPWPPDFLSVLAVFGLQPDRMALFA